jgi:alanyl-tRNA synthetase
MTKRLYYHDTFLHEFDGTVTDVINGDRPAVELDQTAFYPTSGGQVFDTGTIRGEGGEARVEQVEETESGEVVHYINPADFERVRPGMKVRGTIDTFRRRDHMQQHSGQHVLSAAFERLYRMATVSFHMGAETCTIDLATAAVSDEQLKKAEALANQVVFENRPVGIRFVSVDEAKTLGLRKLPDVGKDELRLIDIADFDLCACGGTHVQTTAQIGMILVRKSEKVKQGYRVEFVCGDRALRTARKDFETLTQAATLYSAALGEVPANIRKSLDEIKSAQKQQHTLLEELAELWAERLVHTTPLKPKEGLNGAPTLQAPADQQQESNAADKSVRGTQTTVLVKQVFADRDLAFVKLLAQKLAKHAGVVALLGSTQGQAAIVFSRSSDVDIDVSVLMKEVMASVGGRGGGSKDLAQGGVPDAAKVAELLDEVAKKIGIR